MPIIIPETLPAKAILESENIFVIGRSRAEHQDIRPLQVAILNLMPTKVETETQLLRLLGNSALQVEITLLHTRTYNGKNTPQDHLMEHYESWEAVRSKRFDGLIVTGAPVEHLEFESVAYWAELQLILDWSESHVYSTLHICWGAQAGLYHRHEVPKHPLAEKMFGVFPHRCLTIGDKLLRGFDDLFWAPHSRHTEIRREDIERVPQLEILAESDIAGIYLVASRDRRMFYLTGHSEYAPATLKDEYERDLSRGLAINPPSNYFQGGKASGPPLVQWRGHAHLLFANWLNYYVYQRTPYKIGRIPAGGTQADF